MQVNSRESTPSNSKTVDITVSNSEPLPFLRCHTSLALCLAPAIPFSFCVGSGCDEVYCCEATCRREGTDVEFVRCFNTGPETFVVGEMLLCGTISFGDFILSIGGDGLNGCGGSRDDCGNACKVAIGTTNLKAKYSSSSAWLLESPARKNSFLFTP
jgi:hypothetical protein